MSQEITIDTHNQTGDSDKDTSSSSNPFAFSAKDLSNLFAPTLKHFQLLKRYGGIEGLSKGLQTNLQNGLSEDETLKPISLKDITGEDFVNEVEQDNVHPGLAPVEGTPFYRRKKIFGLNALPEKKMKSIFELMWIAMQEKVLILLTIAAVVSLALGLYEDFGSHQNTEEPKGPKIRWVEGVAIIVAILIVVLVGSLNDWQKERQFQRLNSKKEDRNVKVIRNGKESLLSVHDVLVGDVLLLEPGDVIAVDGILIAGHNLRCDESAATGESDAVKKVKYEDCLRAYENESDSKVDPFILSGSKVIEGVGTYLVTGVGVHSFFGKIMMSLRTDAEDTPLQEKLNDLAEKIAKLGGAAALLMFIVLLIRYFVEFRNGVPPAHIALSNLIQIVISTVTVIVVAVPEGLPLAVTLALAYATTRMLLDNNLVRVLAACETMGNATTVCSDKTGTLTQNKMTVVAGILGLFAAFAKEDREVAKDETHSEKSPQVTDNADLKKLVSLNNLPSAIPKDVLQLLNESIAINSTAFEGDAEDGKRTFIGSKTETALLGFILDLGLDDIKSLRDNAQKIQVFPFNSERKSMGVVIKINDSKWRFYVKGASEVILKKSSKIVDLSGDDTTTSRVVDLNKDRFDRVLRIIEEYASQTLRTIGLAYRDFEQWPPIDVKVDTPDEIPYESLFDNLTLLGIVGIEDPLREGVREAVKSCTQAGVKVRMVTGDNILTAKSIATQCGIYTGGVIMEGPVFRELPPDQMDEMLPRLQVLARSSPEDKRILVGRLKKLGDVVAVTGDGTNDGPALKLSDVGFSMGIAGTEVAKEASSIILMDDNFSSIVKALMWGRNVNDAVKKFLQFQLTVNVTAVLITFITAVSSPQQKSVLSAVQLLWVNLIMDTFAALALATDPPTKALLNRKPEPRNASLITHDMWKMIIGQSIFQLVITLVLYYAGQSILGDKSDAEKQTVIFNTFVFLQIFNEINCRRLDSRINIFKGALANKFLLIIFFIMVAGQVLIVQFGGAAFQVTSIDIISWLICVGLGFLSIPVGVIIRLIPEMRMLTTSSDDETDPEKGLNDAITQVQNQLKIYQTLRGGRFRAHFGDKKEKLETRSKAIEAATILPSLISASVGVQMTNRDQEKRRNIRTNSTSLSENQNASEKNQDSSEPKPEKNEDASGNQDGANEDAIEIQKDS